MTTKKMASPNRFRALFGEELDQGPGHSEVLLCSQMCQYSRVFQKGDTPLGISKLVLCRFCLTIFADFWDLGGGTSPPMVPPLVSATACKKELVEYYALNGSTAIFCWNG